MKLSSDTVYSLIDQLRNGGTNLHLLSIVWVKPDGSDAILRTEGMPMPSKEYISGGCLGVILRRGIEWED